MTMSEKDIIELAAQKAAQVTLETLAKQKKKERRERRDWRLRNTRLLLEHLQQFDTHAHKSVYDVRKVLNRRRTTRKASTRSSFPAGRMFTWRAWQSPLGGPRHWCSRQSRCWSSTVCSAKMEMRKSSGGIVSWRPIPSKEKIINRSWMRKRSQKYCFPRH